MYRVLDLFAGAGGFSEGFRQTGFKIVGGIENMKAVAETFAKNFGVDLVVEDIKKVDSRMLKEIYGEVDVVIGGPPCEAFTPANFKRMPDPLDRLYKDPRGLLTLHFIRIVGDLKPKVFVMENVPQIAVKPLKEALKFEFNRVGFDVKFNILRAEDYGTPSRRTRIFISNIRIKPKKNVRPKTVWDAIGDLPDPRGYHNVPNHDYVPLSRRKLRKISRLRWGEALVTFIGADGKPKRNYLRLWPYRLAPPVMGKSRFIHPFENRLLTVREHARLMGFPDNFVFYGGRDVQFDQVGEAVPVPLARAIAERVKRYLDES